MVRLYNIKLCCCLCLALDTNMKAEVEYRVQKVKSRCKKLSAPEDGGSYDVLKARPLVQQMIDYRVVDAAYMPNLFQNYNLRLKDMISLAANGHWARKIIEATKARVMLAKGPELRESSMGPCWD